MTTHAARSTATRPRRAALTATALLTLGLGLGACGQGGQGGPGGPATEDRTGGTTGVTAAWSAPEPARVARGLAEQADAQQRAAVAEARERTAPVPSGERGGQCTTRPEDRANCTRPPGQEGVSPDGGDVDGDGVYESDEPVGPGYRDPRAYDGGSTSGETQCEWLRRQGVDC